MVGLGGSSGLAVTGMAVHGCVCAGEPRTEPGHGPPSLLSGIYQPCHSGMVLFPYCVIFISPQMRMFLDLSNASSAAGSKEGAFILSPSPPLPSFALAALLLHVTSYEADKNKHVFVCIYWSRLQFG